MSFSVPWTRSISCLFSILFFVVQVKQNKKHFFFGRILEYLFLIGPGYRGTHLVNTRYFLSSILQRVMNATIKKERKK